MIGGLKFNDETLSCVVGGQRSMIKYFNQIIEEVLDNRRTSVKEVCPQRFKIYYRFYCNKDIRLYIRDNQHFSFLTISSMGRIFK